ncbi:MAG: radical SAM protein [Bacteroidales bacterium]|nr:radical SAM protein [Bacteroidales bacterium]MBK7628636.1 radical SAM protein [Bacteroidales bacterium]
MRYSKYNIFSKIRDSENYFIINLLTGNADILTGSDAEKIEAIRKGEPGSGEEIINELTEKGYLIEEPEETKLYRSRYLDFIDSRDKDEIQIFFVTNYSCNFACTYCYQDQYNNPHLELSNDITDAFFDYVRREFAGRKKYITVFGGEPLLGSPKQKELISYLLKKSAEADLEVSFVTNGYSLEEYSDILKSGKIREVQVTLDGTESVHNNRRFLKGGEGTFSRIVRGIDSCIDNHIDVNLRMVADKENINNLPDLAQFAIDKGWTKSPYFKTQIGRNYELHHCQSSPDMLFDRVSLYESIYELTKKHPQIVEFYKPAYSVAKFLSENGELPDPLFDACPACKTEWAFDYTGQIYSCTATVGKSDESLGTFYPVVSRKSDLIDQWERRDVTAIPECKECSVQLACGGGCGSVAKNRTGKICSTDCRPVKELLELGFSAYIENTAE